MMMDRIFSTLKQKGVLGAIGIVLIAVHIWIEGPVIRICYFAPLE